MEKPCSTCPRDSLKAKGAEQAASIVAGELSVADAGIMAGHYAVRCMFDREQGFCGDTAVQVSADQLTANVHERHQALVITRSDNVVQESDDTESRPTMPRPYDRSLADMQQRGERAAAAIFDQSKK